LFLKSLDRLRFFLSEREKMRSLSTRAYYLVRMALLEWAKRNKISDPFMFKASEILYQNLPDEKILANRKNQYLGMRKLKAPNEFGGAIKQDEGSFDPGDIKGVGCSPGIYRGRARVILNLEDASELRTDEILVTVFTDPGWTPVLARISGVITEVGGILSHAAVIGREYKIPAILNVPHATALIQTGDLIEMDGKSGKIKLLEISSQ
jgi:phosphohistidine swiveling domain-containing protein